MVTKVQKHIRLMRNLKSVASILTVLIGVVLMWNWTGGEYAILKALISLGIIFVGVGTLGAVWHGY